MAEKISPRAVLELGTARSVGKLLTNSATGAPFIFHFFVHLFFCRLKTLRFF